MYVVFSSFRELQGERVLCMLFFASFRELQEGVAVFTERVLRMVFFASL